MTHISDDVDPTGLDALTFLVDGSRGEPQEAKGPLPRDRYAALLTARR